MTCAQLLLFLSLLLTASAQSSTIEPVNVSFLTNLIGSFRGPNKINVTQFLSTFSLPACMKQCLPEIDGLLVALSKSNDTQDMAEICRVGFRTGSKHEKDLTRSPLVPYSSAEYEDMAEGSRFLNVSDAFYYLH
ncbi:hypothetical protein ANCCAN_27119 [Ancylostoma caninum]|uniref:Uncharacterized protein n=1 Tax=Ancylostoma caninum TaxID=29170 RepID=A0A368F6D4_ANCCA|nr:hypothetical protein ANCCAN_27119 [Ancylostoma caninum]